jgi:hypothetical protein
MFTTKKTQLIKPKVAKRATPMSSRAKTPLSVFVSTGLAEQAVVRSGNGSKKFDTTMDVFVDQFNKLGTFKAPRTYADVAKDIEAQWDADPLNAVKFALFVRGITRKVTLPDGTTTSDPQKGGELKHEGLFRMLWLSQNAPETFWKNVGLFVALGSWHDIFTMLQYDLVYNGWEGRKLNWNKFGSLVASALKNPNTVELVKKYLPQLKANSACKTVESQANNIIAKWLCNALFGKKNSSNSYKSYRKLKTSGTAHEWQQLISKQKFSEIDFAKIHGRALNLLVRSKFLFNQNLSKKYEAWVKKPETKLKYTGFVHELFANLPSYKGSLDTASKETINKQFAALVDKGKEGELKTRMIVVRDTSASMNRDAIGTNMSSNKIGKAMALYFSEFLSGKFANSFIEFNSDAKMHTWQGETPIDKWYNDTTTYVGSTNFESVIRLFAKIKKEGVSESEFPTGILCISDGEFNKAQLDMTNVASARKILRDAGFSKNFADNFVIVLWNIPNAYYGKAAPKFETYSGDVPNVFYFSGYNTAVISFLTGEGVKSARDLFDEAMDQEILNRVEI